MVSKLCYAGLAATSKFLGGRMLTTIQKINSMLIKFLSRFEWLPLLLLRLSIGYVFLLSGQGKLLNLERTASYFASLHIPFALFNAILASSTEFLGGILLMAGLFTRVTSLALGFVMVIAIVTARLPNIGTVGEFAGLIEWAYLLIFVSFVFAGAGAISLDKLFKIDSKN